MKKDLPKIIKWKLPELKCKPPNPWIKHQISLKEYFKSIMIATLMIAMISYLFYENLVLSIFFSPYIHFYIKQKSKEIDRKRKSNLNNQFKDGMIAVSFALNVGYSIENSFREALGELVLLYGKDSMIVREFKTIIHRISINENIEDVLDDFARRSEVEDILYFAEVFRYAKRSGGDLIAIIKNTAKTISDKSEVTREINTIISGKQMEQRVMSVIPFGIIMYLKLTSPEFMKPMYHNFTGMVIMTICLGMYVVSNTLAKRIIRIEV